MIRISTWSDSDHLANNSDSNGITGSGLLTAGYIDLNAAARPGRPERQHRPGPPGLPAVAGDQRYGQPLSLAIRTYSGNAYINSAVAVSIDDQTTALE